MLKTCSIDIIYNPDTLNGVTIYIKKPPDNYSDKGAFSLNYQPVTYLLRVLLLLSLFLDFSLFLVPVRLPDSLLLMLLLFEEPALLDEDTDVLAVASFLLCAGLL